MYLFKSVFNIFGSHCVLFCIFFRSVIGIKNELHNRNTLSEENDGQSENPWESFMRRYDIPNNHRSGVYIDLGASVKINPDDTYMFPNGTCPIFGKTIKMGDINIFNDINFEGISSKNISDLLIKNKLPNYDVYDNEQYKYGLNYGSKIYLKSPETKTTIVQCAEYTKLNFPHRVENEQKKSYKVYHPFIYDFSKGLCYVLFPLWQRMQKPGTDDLFVPQKVNKPFVFGSYNIKANWKTSCPIKPLKGVKFGIWRNGKCVEESKNHQKKSLDECPIYLFSISPNDEEKKSEGKGKNWANWVNDECRILENTPNCLIYDKDAYAFTSTAMSNHTMHDLPPCIKASVGWKINATCFYLRNTEFTCTEYGKWVTDEGHEISTCFSNSPVEEVDEISMHYRSSSSFSSSSPTKLTKTTSSANFLTTGGVFAAIIFYFIHTFFFL